MSYTIDFNPKPNDNSKRIFDFYYDIKKQIKVFMTDEDLGQTIELNYISYKGGRPKYDLRKWVRYPKSDTRMLKGFTLTKEELIAIKDGLNEIDFGKLE